MVFPQKLVVPPHNIAPSTQLFLTHFPVKLNTNALSHTTQITAVGNEGARNKGTYITGDSFIKALPLEPPEMDDITRSEAGLHQQLSRQFPFVSQVKGAHQTNNELWLQFEHLQGQSLEQFLRIEENQTQRLVLEEIIKNQLLTVAQEADVYLFDRSPKNIFVVENPETKQRLVKQLDIDPRETIYLPKDNYNVCLVEYERYLAHPYHAMNKSHSLEHIRQLAAKNGQQYAINTMKEQVETAMLTSFKTFMEFNEAWISLTTGQTLANMPENAWLTLKRHFMYLAHTFGHEI
jgi:hypothetical protein